MKNYKLLFVTLLTVTVLGSNFAAAQAKNKCDKVGTKNKKCYVESSEGSVFIDRSQRTNPYANTPSYGQGGNSDRYSTSQGWSRGYGNYWYGGRSSDMASTGYNTPRGY